MKILVSCDVVNNCHPYANCEYDQNVQRYHCVCVPGSLFLLFLLTFLKHVILLKGYDGNGLDCIEVEANCAQEDICDIHADCLYNITLRKNICVCQVFQSFFKVKQVFMPKFFI